MSQLPVANGVVQSGWGRFPSAQTDLYRPERRSSFLEVLAREQTLIPRGLGRSYGDAAHNGEGATVLMERLNRMLSFDPASRILECEPGVTIQDVLEVFLPRGLGPPVTPGTMYVTLGGCLACDVHGKNHHHSGSFSRHLVDFELLLPDGSLVTCSRKENPDLFWATIGGMGLTGIVTGLRIRLKSVPSQYVVVDYDKARDLDEALALFEASDDTYEYSVAWIDCLARGSRAGRSVLIRGNDAGPEHLGSRPRQPRGRPTVRVPMNMPSGLLNRYSVRWFNALYYGKAPRTARNRVEPFQKFFYPLDSVRDWNRIYGTSGFVQYQFVVPRAAARAALQAVLSRISKAGQASFLAVLKAMGAEEPDQLLSFPREGYTLAVDIPWKAGRTERLLAELDRIVIDHGGRVYLAKDARLSPEAFRSMYPRMDSWREIKRRVDPDNKLRSDLAERVGLLA